MDVNEDAEFDIFDDETSKKIQEEYEKDMDDAAKAIGARRMGLITGDAEKSTTETWSAAGKGLMKKLSSASSLFSRKTAQAPPPPPATTTATPTPTAPYVSPNVQPPSESIPVPPAVVEPKATPKDLSPEALSPEALTPKAPSSTRPQDQAPEDPSSVASGAGKETLPVLAASGAAADAVASTAALEAVATTGIAPDRLDAEGIEPEGTTITVAGASADDTTASSPVAAAADASNKSAASAPPPVAAAVAAAAASEKSAAPAPAAPVISAAEAVLPELKVLPFDVREPSLGASVVGHVVVLAGSCYVWAGAEGSSSQGSLAAAVGTRFDGGMPTATPLLTGEGASGGGEAGGAAAVATGGVSVSMAQRLCRRTGRMVFVSCDLSEDSQILVAAVEAKVVALLKAEA